MEKRSLLERITEGIDLTGEPVPGQPIIEIAGNNQVLIENHYGINQYSREKICIKVRYGIVAVCGCGMELTRMTREQLIISGRIDHISLIRRGKS